MRNCSKCGDYLDLEYFSKDSRGPRGRKSACKACVKASDNTYRKKPGVKERRNVQARAYTAVWQQQEEVKAKRRARQQNRRSSAGHMPGNTLSLLIEAHGNKCMNPECRSGAEITIDHILPLYLGGTHDFDNLQLLCRSCNCSKGRWSTTDYRICLLNGSTVRLSH